MLNTKNLKTRFLCCIGTAFQGGIDCQSYNTQREKHWCYVGANSKCTDKIPAKRPRRRTVKEALNKHKIHKSFKACEHIITTTTTTWYHLSSFYLLLENEGKPIALHYIKYGC